MFKNIKPLIAISIFPKKRVQIRIRNTDFFRVQRRQWKREKFYSKQIGLYHQNNAKKKCYTETLMGKILY